jgi:hypothetical protein
MGGDKLLKLLIKIDSKVTVINDQKYRFIYVKIGGVKSDENLSKMGVKK